MTGPARKGPLKDSGPPAGGGEREGYLLLSEKFSSLLAGSAWGGGKSGNAACQSPAQREAAFVPAEPSGRGCLIKVIEAGRGGFPWGAV